MLRRHSLLVLLAILLLAATSADAQRLRGRFHSKGSITDAAPVLVITGPTGESTFRTTASTVTLTATAGDDRALTRVTWSNDRGGSGTADLSLSTVNLGTASVVGASTTSTLFQDAFSANVNTALTAWSPIIGTGWTEGYDTATNDDSCTVYAGSGSVGVSTTRTSEAIICLATGSTPSGEDYYLDFGRADLSNTGSAVAEGAIFAWQDANNYCGVRLTRNTTANLRLFKRVANTVTALADVDMIVSATAAFRIDVSSGDAVKVFASTDLVTPLISVTSTECAQVGQAGVGFGPIHITSYSGASSRQDTDSRITDFLVVDRGATSGIVLQSGVNVITVCAEDNHEEAGVPTPQQGCDTLTVTKDVADTTPPVASITDPTSGTTSTALETIFVHATDNVGVTSLTPTCPACAGVGSVTGTTLPATDADLQFAVTLTCDGSTHNIISVTPADAEGNSATAVSIDRVCTPTATDTTAAVPVIKTDGGNGEGVNYSTSATSVALAGTASDAAPSSGCCTVTWTNDRGGSGTAAGAATWTIGAISLQVGANLITVTACDGLTQCSTDTITITRTAATLSLDTATLPGGLQNSVYGPVPLTISGGTAPYTCSLGSGTFPTGITLSGTGSCTVSGTPTGTGTSSGIVLHVVDNVGATDDSVSLSITINAAGSDQIVTYGLMSDKKYQWDWRTAATAGANAQGRFVSTSGANNHPADPTRGVEFSFPFWEAASTSGFTLVNAISTTGVVNQCATAVDYTSQGISCLVITPGSNDSARTCDDGKWVLLDDELVIVTKPVGAGGTCPGEPVTTTRGMFVRRAQVGTTATTHAAGTPIIWNTNKEIVTELAMDLTNATANTSHASVPDGTVSVYIWDFFVPLESAYIPSLGTKTFQNTSYRSAKSDGATITWETRILGQQKVAVPTALTRCGVSFTRNVATANVPDVRVYNTSPGTTTDWLSTDGETLGLGFYLSGDTLCPQTNIVQLVPGQWWKFVTRIWQRANDFEVVDTWIGSETQDMTQMHDTVLASFSHNPAVLNCTTCYGQRRFRYEIDTSSDDPIQERIDNGRTTLKFYSRHFTMLQQTVPGGGTLDDTTLNNANLVSRGILDRPQ